MDVALEKHAGTSTAASASKDTPPKKDKDDGAADKEGAGGSRKALQVNIYIHMYICMYIYDDIG